MVLLSVILRGVIYRGGGLSSTVKICTLVLEMWMLG